MSEYGNPPQEPNGEGDDPKTQIRQPGSPSAPQYGNPEYQQQPAYGQPDYAQQPNPYSAPQGYGQPQGYAQPTYAGPITYATWGQRAVASLWDVVYVWPILAGYIVGGILMAAGGSMDNGAGTALLIVGIVIMLVGVVWGIWRFISNYFLDQGRTGYTWGKRKVGIKLVLEATGQPAGPLSAVGRYFLHGIINQACYLDYLWPLWDDKNQTLTDKILSTIEIQQPADGS
jgi:uncharacterized RDD family membrane protein YckC